MQCDGKIPTVETVRNGTHFLRDRATWTGSGQAVPKELVAGMWSPASLCLSQFLPDSGKDSGQKKRASEDEMARWHQ